MGGFWCGAWVDEWVGIGGWVGGYAWASRGHGHGQQSWVQGGPKEAVADPAQRQIERDGRGGFDFAAAHLNRTQPVFFTVRENHTQNMTNVMGSQVLQIEGTNLGTVETDVQGSS